MSKDNSKVFLNVSQIFLDIVFILISFIGAIFISYRGNYLHTISRIYWFFIIFAAFYICVMYILNMFFYTTFLYQDRILRRVLASSIFSYLFCFFLLSYCMTPEEGTKPFTVVFLLITIVLLPSQRIIGHEIRKRNRNRWKNRLLLIGNVENIKEYLYFLGKTGFTFNTVGYIPTDDGIIPEYPIAGKITELGSVLAEKAIDEVVFTIHYSKINDFQEYIAYCEERNLIVRLALDFSEMNSEKNYVYNIGTLPILTFHSSAQGLFGKFIKRMADMFMSMILIILLSFLLIIPLLKKLFGTENPIFISTVTYTINWRKFKMIEFYTCDRGRYSRFLLRSGLNSYPRLFNVFCGDMSVVGTRPVRESESGNMTKQQIRSMTLKPGLTGVWWLSLHDPGIENDLCGRHADAYVEKWSFFKDILIFAESAILFICGKADNTDKNGS